MKPLLTNTLRAFICMTCAVIVIANMFLLMEAVRIQRGIMMNAEMISDLQCQINELELKFHKK